MAIGLIGTKVGMTQVFTESGELVPVTVISAGSCSVTQRKTPATDGYSAVQIGAGDQKPQRLTAADRGHRRKSGKLPATLHEFRRGGERSRSRPGDSSRRISSRPAIRST